VSYLNTKPLLYGIERSPLLEKMELITDYPASIAGMCGYWIAGLWTPTVTRYYVTSLPLVIAAIFLGRAVNQRMNGKSFLLYVHGGLILIGALLLVQTAAH